MSGCNLELDVAIWDSGLDVTDFGKQKRLTNNPATRPFWVFVGSGIDVKGKFGRLQFEEKKNGR